MAVEFGNAKSNLLDVFFIFQTICAECKFLKMVTSSEPEADQAG